MTASPGAAPGEAPAITPPPIGPATFPALFARSVELHPTATAVVTPDHEVSYAELGHRIDRVARVLISRGVGPEDVVAVVAERGSIDWLCVLLGTLTAGAGYLSLDPAYPADRLAFMLDDSEPRLVVGPAEWTARLPARRDLPVADLTELTGPDGLDGPSEPPVTDAERRSPLGPDNLLYLVYTSGSTGTPKGVAVSHRGLAALAESQRRAVGTGPGDRVLQWASPSFDAAFWDITLALLHGATLHLAAATDLMPGEPLAELLRARGISHATIPPVALDALPDGELDRVGTIVTTGDTCTSGLVRRWAPGRRLINGYGPTETTVGATLSAALVADEPVDIGRPFAEARIDVLDDSLVDVPTGGTGQLAVAGPGVARGYLGRPALTADRFRPDPSGPPGTRRYLTGDLGRRDGTGRYHFQGRRDGQVKLRGFRIEVGEVEATLSAHPDVTAAAVVVGTADHGGYLHALLSVARPVSDAELRDFLGRRLPAHMVPATLTVLDRLPTTANGKIDRARLTAAAADASSNPAPASPPTPSPAAADSTQDYVRALFADVLGIADVGADQDFFDLGGHSILLTRIVARMRAERSVPLSLRTAFADRTPRGLAAALDAAADQG